MGRTAELRVLIDLVDGALESRAGSLVVVGEAGVGKTALLDEAATYARTQGALVLTVAGVPAERAVPGSAVSVLAGQVAAVVGPSGPGTDVRAAPGTDLPGVLELLAALPGPTVVVADDVHWWDGASRAALVFAARRLSCDPVAVVLAGRPEAVDDRGIAALGRLDLGPLPRSLAGELARTVAADAVDGVAERIWSAVGGNTLALLESVSRLRPDERAGLARLPDDPRVGPGVVERWAAEVGALPDETRRALVVLAVVAPEDPLDPVLALLGAAADDLRPAEGAGLVAAAAPRPSFRHPLVRFAVLAQASPEDVRAVHAAAAASLEAGGATAQQVHRRARHRAAAAFAPDDSLTTCLVRDAEELVALGAPRSAADVLELAALGSGDGEAAAVLLHRAAALALDDFDDDAAARLALAGLDHPASPATRGRLLHIAGLATARVSDARLGCSLLGESLQLLSGEERQGVVRDLIFALDLTRYRDSEAVALLAEMGPPERLEPMDRLLVAHAYDHASGGTDTAQLLREAFAEVTVAEATATGSATETVINAGLDVGLDVSGPVLRLVVESLLASGDPRRRLDGLGIDMLVAFWDGRWDDLDAIADETAELSEAIGRIDLYSDGMRLQLLSRRGDEEGFAGALARAQDVMGAAGMDFWTGAFAGERAMLSLTSGRPEEALAILQDVPFRSMVRLVPHTVYTDHLLMLVELLADSGRALEAREEADRMTALLGPSPSTLGRGLLERAAAATGEDADVPRHLAAAEDLIGAGVHVFELAMTRLRHARWLRRHRRKAEAAELLQLARSSFEVLRCASWVRACDDELAAVGAGAARHERYDISGALTAQERRVAEAVAEGITNDEAARRLFLSPRTVEVHLTHVYRKLGVRGRSDLARLMASRQV